MVQQGVMNTLLLLSMGSLMPFMISFYSIRLYIPCPQMAAVVSNSLVGVVLVAMVVFSIPMYGFTFKAFIFVFCVWPFIPIACIGVTANILMMMSPKYIT